MAYNLHISIRKSGFELQLTEVLTADLIFVTWWKQLKKLEEMLMAQVS